MSIEKPTSFGNAPFAVDDFEIDPRANNVTARNGATSNVEPKVMRLLVVLAAHCGEVAPRDMLIDEVWGVEHGGDESLSRAISLLRKAFHDDRGARHIIETIPKSGYRLNAAVREIDAGAADNRERVPRRRSPSALSPGLTAISAIVAAGVIGAAAAGYFLIVADGENAPPDRSVAVLPFAVLSSGEEDAYFADGVTEDIINALWALPELTVVASPIVRDGDDQNGSRLKLARSLGVAHLVEGAVRVDEEKVRVTAKLIRASDNRQIWSNGYDRALPNLLDIQTDIARRIAQALDIVLDEDKIAAMNAAGLRNIDAYVPYYRANILQAKAHGELPQIPTLIEANKLFMETTSHAPGYFPAYFVQTDLYTHILLDAASGWSDSHAPHHTPETASAEFSSLLKTAYAAARSDLERAYVGAIRSLFSDDWSAAGSYLDTVLATESCAIDEQWTQILSIAFGRAEKARRFFEHTTRCAPAYNIQWINAAMASLYLNDPDRAQSILEEGKVHAGFNPLLERTRLQAYLAAGRDDDAEQLLNNFSGRARTIEQISLHAFRNEREAASRLAAQLYAYDGDESFDDLAGPLGDREDALILLLAPILGDRDAANDAAARIDARPYGPTQLAISVYYCLCGAPFDLEATPNFAARLSEGDLKWPPSSPIDYPLKTW
ncbi:MAG: winged helix-turn-helix domain-containing protein [Pseudomonadota bacterium]